VDGLRIVRHPRLQGVELHEVRNRVSKRPAMVTMELKVAVIVNGANRFSCRGSSAVLSRGETLVVRPDDVHSVEPDGASFDANVIQLGPRVLAKLGEGALDGWHTGCSLRGPISSRVEFQCRYRQLIAALHSVDASSLLLDERLQSFIDALRSAYLVGREEPATRGSNTDGVRRARGIIHDRYAESISLDALAEVSGLTATGFIRAFKREVGLPPHAYQTRLRIDHARRLIAGGETIAEACTAVGFFDQSHFHRHFVRVLGYTPGDYRNRPTTRAA
jgi:AraC-like DNA-binding protein